MRDFDFDDENNVENYGKRPKFANFVVPNGNETVMIQVDWEEAAEFAIEEATEEELLEIGANNWFDE